MDRAPTATSPHDGATGRPPDDGDHRRAAILAALREVLPADVLVTDPGIIEPYRHDRAEMATPGHPLAVVRAATTSQVQATMRVAAAHRVPVVPRGAGTGLSGGSSAIDGCITLSTASMRSLSIEPDSMLAVVGPGVLNAELKAAAAQHGLWYPPDPSSYEICSIGGNVATNAGGLCCVKYGVTTDYVLGLEVVLPDATALRLGGRTVKNVTGYDLKRLFLGSEGTLGVITEVVLRLRASPGPATTLVATFDGAPAAGRAVVEIVRRARPSTLELMDRAAIVAVEQLTHMGFDEHCAAMLLAQSDAGGPQAEADIELMRQACESAGALEVHSTADPDEGHQLMAARRAAIPAVERLGTVLIEDIGVPVPRIPDLLAGVEELATRRDTLVAVIGHAGDGNFHPLVTFDRHDPDAVGRAQRCFGEIMELALGLGGTITGEHGVGTLKLPWVADQLGPEVLALTARIKHAIDPLSIMNPGKAL